MAAFIVSIDHEHAKVFKLIPGEVETAGLDKHLVRHHTSSENQKKKDSGPFFHEVAQSLQGATEILVVGHGVAKDQFVHHLEDHGHQELRKKVVGVESVNHPTDAQLIALARKFFKHQHLFTS